MPSYAKSQPFPSFLSRNGEAPSWNATPTPFGFAGVAGSFVSVKSMPSPASFFQVLAAASQYVYFYLSDHGTPLGSADARLYSWWRFAGQAQPQFGLTQPSFLPGSISPRFTT